MEPAVYNGPDGGEVFPFAGGTGAAGGSTGAGAHPSRLMAPFAPIPNSAASDAAMNLMEMASAPPMMPAISKEGAALPIQIDDSGFREVHPGQYLLRLRQRLSEDRAIFPPASFLTVFDGCCGWTSRPS